MFIHDWAWKIVRWLPQGLGHRLAGLKHRLWWQRVARNYHVNYFEGYRDPGRCKLVDTIAAWAASTGLRVPKILEFGCSGGNNLKLMRERLPFPVTYCGVDLVPAAIQFAQSEFSGARFVLADDQAFPSLVPDLGHFDLFFAPGVFCYIPPERAGRLLVCAARCADYVLVCDLLSQFDAPAGQADRLFYHPYAALLRQAGLEILHCETSLTPGNPFGYFLARATPPRATVTPNGQPAPWAER